MSDRRLPRVAGPIGALLFFVLAGVVGQLAARRMSTGDDDSDDVRRVAILGGIELASRAAALRSAHVLAVLGGTEVDLGGARLDPSGATLEVTAVLGGVEVAIPADWRAEVEVAGRLGGIDNRLADGPDPTGGGPVLHVRASAWLGGIELRRSSRSTE